MENKNTNEYLLDKLKNDFQNIRLILEETNLAKTIILEKIEQTKILYQELIKTNHTKIFIFCLDSLYFQYKLSLMDYDSMKKNLSFIMNRMYCDYYKLYNIIVLEIKEKCFLEIEVKTFQPYKDLDVLHEYSFEMIIIIHNEILSLIDRLYSKYRDGTSVIENYVETKRSVVSISNFLNTLKYENGLFENQIMLYINYMSFFHFSQNKMLVRLYSKMVEFNNNIDEYSNINNIVSIDDIKSILTEKEVSMSISISGSCYDDIVKHETTTPISDITENNSVMEKEYEKSSLLEKEEVIVEESIFLEKEEIIVEEPIVEVIVEEPIVLEKEEVIVEEQIVEELIVSEKEEEINLGIVEEENVDIIKQHFDLISLSNSESDEDIYCKKTDSMIEEFYSDVFPKELEL